MLQATTGTPVEFPPARKRTPPRAVALAALLLAILAAWSCLGPSRLRGPRPVVNLRLDGSDAPGARLPCLVTIAGDGSHIGGTLKLSEIDADGGRDRLRYFRLPHDLQELTISVATPPGRARLELVYLYDSFDDRGVPQPFEVGVEPGLQYRFVIDHGREDNLRFVPEPRAKQ